MAMQITKKMLRASRSFSLPQLTTVALEHTQVPRHKRKHKYSFKLPNPRRERFCQLYHRTGNATRSYAIAYSMSASNSARAAGSRLLSFAAVRERIAEIAHMAAKRHDVTVDSLVEDLERAEALARSIEQPAAMVSAIVAKAKVTGHMIERRETGKAGTFEQLASVDDVLAAVRSELGDAAAEAIAAALVPDRTRDPGTSKPEYKLLNAWVDGGVETIVNGKAE